MLGVPPAVPVVTRDQVRYAKPDPDLFLAAAERLGVPIDSAVVVGDSVWDLLAAQRGEQYVDVDRSATLDWEALRARIAADGMRNSNCVAIAPTATISNIIGVDASIEPCFGNLSVKSNLSGEFTVINSYLVKDLKRLGLWDDVMVMDLKHFDGSLRRIDRVPEDLKALYATAFEIETQWLVEAAARRQKWIDQAQSLNIYMAGASGKKLDETYKLAWQRGLKTTYYLRTISASSAEKSTVSKTGQLNSVSSGAPAMVSAPAAAAPEMPEAEGAVCMMRPGDPGFEEAFQAMSRGSEVWDIAAIGAVQSVIRPQDTREYLIRMLQVHRSRPSNGVGQHLMRAWPTSF